MTDLDLTIDRDRLDAVRRGAAVVVDHPAVFRITGPGALTCLQGIFTNDLDHPGDGSLIYGAMLTSKGMIVVDGWVLRHLGALTLIAPVAGREAMREIFQRTLPPRLARAEDVTDSSRVLCNARAAWSSTRAAPDRPSSRWLRRRRPSRRWCRARLRRWTPPCGGS